MDDKMSKKSGSYYYKVLRYVYSNLLYYISMVLVYYLLNNMKFLILKI